MHLHHLYSLKFSELQSQKTLLIYHGLNILDIAQNANHWNEEYYDMTACLLEVDILKCEAIKEAECSVTVTSCIGALGNCVNNHLTGPLLKRYHNNFKK